MLSCLSSGILMKSRNGISLSVSATIRPKPYWSCTNCQLICSPKTRAIKPLGVNRNAKPTANATCGRAITGANRDSICFHHRLCQHDCKIAKQNKAESKVLAKLTNSVNRMDLSKPGQASNASKPAKERVY